MQKNSSEVVALVLDRIKKYGPQSLAAGAGVAGLAHLISEYNQRQREEERGKPKSLYIDLPKTANVFSSPSGSQYLLDSAVGVGSVLGAGAVGYQIVDSVLKKVRKSRMQSELEEKKKQYSELLAQKIYNSENKYAAESKYPMIEGLIASVVDSTHDMDTSDLKEKIAISDPTTLSTITSLPGLGALLAGILAHKYWYNRDKDIHSALLKEEAETSRRTPPTIKLRTVHEEDEEKSAGLLDGGFLDNLSTAHSMNEILSEKEQKEEKPKSNSFPSRKKVYSPSDVQDIDNNTVVIRTDDGETQVEALDPEAAEKLEKYKEVIAKSLALGANLNRRPLEE
jgi:hypothetical protein